VIEWSAAGQDIQLQLLGDDDVTHKVELSRECASVLASALAAEVEKGAAVEGQQQFIRPVGLQTGKTALNEPVLFMTLQGGAELPLVFQTGVLGPLIAELQKLKLILEPGGDVRWV
jgi:hypothetical protein